MSAPDFSPFAQTIFEQKYAHAKPDGGRESWTELAERVVVAVLSVVPAADRAALAPSLRADIEARRFLPGGRYLYAAGRPVHQVQNCLLLRADDSREGWAELLRKAALALMTGAGIGVDYSALRPNGAAIARTGGTSSGPLALMKIVNELGRHVIQGGARRSAIWAGLSWRHADIIDLIAAKDWSPAERALKAADPLAPAPLDGTNVSVILDAAFFAAHAAGDAVATKVYDVAVRSMLRTGEPGFSVDVVDARESLRNACTEITSADDSDICNLGSLNLARFETLTDFAAAVERATAFLLAGSIYSDVPYAEVAAVRAKNRRLGLGLMGIHEWLLKRGKRYEQDAELGTWLATYRDVATATATRYAERWGVSVPVKTRAIAPTGTIGIVAETTTGIEPIFCVAYRRRYLVPHQGSSGTSATAIDGLRTHRSSAVFPDKLPRGDAPGDHRSPPQRCAKNPEGVLGADSVDMKVQYVVDPTAARLIALGVSPAAIEDAYTLAADVERRVAMQAWVQEFVDHGISSTINLPSWGTPGNDEDGVARFAAMLLRYLPRLRGLTCYPDGARSGQPLVRVGYDEACRKIGMIADDVEDACSLSGRVGDCGS